MPPSGSIWASGRAQGTRRTARGSCDRAVEGQRKGKAGQLAVIVTAFLLVAFTGAYWTIKRLAF